ncbi:Protoglobin-domain-containing protein [Aspergillus pseudocaelatus]|uniref:Protoglobin-domain-containing protein n=1 Tax=Aspergillus pseudocaelatus TaxID=1825620 RepID=A0ABQ6WPR2_9EURO|nr:Protoglobin-domain-containing protein [Aspergillus pseudocaelatus]
MDPVAPVQEDIRRVGRKELYTDFGKRMEYIKTFLDFTDDDVIIFNKGSKYLKTVIPELTHRLYEKMLEFDITARALRTRSTASEAQIEDLFTIDSPQVQRRKIFWKWYLTRLCSDPGQPSYWEYLRKVGEMHTGKVLMHPLTIEYIHMNACLGYVKQLLFETISLHPEMSVKFKFALIRSMSKVFCIQNDLISKCYINEGQEFAEEASNTTNTDNASAKSNTDSASIATGITDNASTRGNTENASTRGNTDNASITTGITDNASAVTGTTDTASTTTADTASITNSEVSSMYREKQSHPHCLIPGFNTSRPNSAGDTQSSIPRDRSGSVDLDRVSSTAETAVSSDCPSTSSSHHITPSVISNPSAFASPFAVGHIHNFETKIWSSGMKQKGSGYK